MIPLRNKRRPTINFATCRSQLLTTEQETEELRILATLPVNVRVYGKAPWTTESRDAVEEKEKDSKMAHGYAD